MAAIAQTKLSLHVGMAHSDANGGARRSFGNPVCYTGRNGLVAGANLQLACGKKITYEPGIFYMGKTVRYYLAPVADYGYRGHEYLHYLTLNQNMVLQCWRSGHLAVSAGAGLYGAMALGGTYARAYYNDIGTSSYETGRLSFGNSDDHRYRRFDLGANMMLRVQYRQWQVTAQLSPSLADYNRFHEARLHSTLLMLGYRL
jgi:hypothetical protein